jgi:vacuolar-type H+-ATPase catalytic subunit A/Vma1
VVMLAQRTGRTAEALRHLSGRMGRCAPG